MSFLGELLDRAGANRASVKEAQFPIDPKNNCTADKEQQQQGNEPPIGMLNLKLFAGERENSPHSSRWRSSWCSTENSGLGLSKASQSLA